MDYISTRGSAPALDFAGATLAGLASDGGLYVPREWPRFTEAEIAAMAGLPYAQLAQRIMQPFVGDSLTPERLLELTTAAYGRFRDAASAKAFIDQKGAPIVVKTDGLAAGKGVTVCQSVAEAHAAVDAAMTGKAFGSAGDELVIEEFLAGEEVSFFAITG